MSSCDFTENRVAGSGRLLLGRIPIPPISMCAFVIAFAIAFAIFMAAFFVLRLPGLLPVTEKKSTINPYLQR
jgi:hypothetical protein